MKYRIGLIIIILSLLAGYAGCGTDMRVDISSLLSDEASNTYIAWRMVRSVGDNDVHLRKNRSGGEVLWDKALFIGDNRRVNISGMVSDENGGVFVIWEVLTPQNGKEGHHDFDRHTIVNVNGQGDITMSRDFFIRGIQISSDGRGGLLVCWYTRENIGIERVDNQGVTLWEYQLESNDTIPQFIAETDGETFILLKILDESYVFVQKLDSDGQAVWGNAGISKGIRINTINTEMNPRMISDNTGGLIVSWSAPTAGGMISNIGAYRISADGEVVYDKTLCELVSPTNGQTRAVSDGSSGGIVVWEDHREGMALYAQKVNNKGQPLWYKNGVAVCTGLPEYSPRFEAVSDGLGGVIVVLMDGDYRLSAQRLDSFGQPQWGDGGIQIAKNVSDRPIIISGDKQHGFTIGWSTGEKSYIQKINAEGNLLWGNSGIELGN